MNDEPFTEKQKAALVQLWRRSATSKESGVRADSPELNVMVLGRLRDRWLVESRVINKGRQWTEYWLTAPGAKAARALI